MRDWHLSELSLILDVVLQVKERKKPVTPYILYASIVRKQTAEKFKGLGFGEISRIVGDMVSFRSRHD